MSRQKVEKYLFVPVARVACSKELYAFEGQKCLFCRKTLNFSKKYANLEFINACPQTLYIQIERFLSHTT